MDISKSTSCFNALQLQQFLGDQLSEMEERAFQEHLGTCTRCQSALEQAAAGPGLWEELSLGSEPMEAMATEIPEDIKGLLAPSDDPDMLGRLGPYEIRAWVGQGSAGLVFKAFEPRLQRYVAIKLLSPAYRSSDVARQRFEREGRAVAAVAHDHVVPIYAVDEYRGLPYIVMQYIPGMSLQQRMERDGALDVCEVTRIGLQVAKALAAAHAQGIVHRDVKPANVLLEATVERAMVTDFGLARVTDDASMTRSGTIAGTPPYMSPEQARGDSIDSRSDLFSLGSLMYAASTGKVPFAAQTVFGVLHRVCEQEPVPIPNLNSETPTWMVALIQKLMNKKPGDRFESATQVAEALTAELAYLQNPHAAPKPKREWMARSSTQLLRRFGPALALSSLAGIAGAGLAFFDGEEDKQPEGGQAASLQAMFSKGGESEAETYPTVVVEGDATDEAPMDPGSILAIQVDVGDVMIRPAEGPNASFRLSRAVQARDAEYGAVILEDHNVGFAEVESGLELRAELGPLARVCSFERILLEVAVPNGVRAEVRTQRGRVTVAERSGDVDITAGGDVRLARIEGEVDVVSQGGDVSIDQGCSGDLDVLAVHGDVHLAGAEANARVRTSGGSVWLGPCTGTTTVQTDGGGVDIYAIAGPLVASASHGDIDVRVAEQPSRAEFIVHRGNVSIALASHVRAQVEARGEFKTEFDSELREVGDGLEDPWRIVRRNGGGTTLTATSSSGEVSLVELSSDWQPAAIPVGFGEGSGEGEELTLDGSLGGSGKGKGLGGSGLGGSGLGGSGLGGSGSSKEHPQDEATSPAGSGSTVAMGIPGEIVPIPMEREDSNLDGYNLYLPVSHEEHEGNYPVLVYLQGGYGVGGSIESINNWGLARLLRDEQDLEDERNQFLLDGFIIVSPHIQNGNYFDDPEGMRAILDAVLASSKGDPDRIAVSGLSRGAHGSWGLAAKLPDTFAAIVPIGGHALGVDDFADLSGISIWVAHNVADGLVEFQGAMDAALATEASCDIQFRWMDGLDVSETDYLEHRYLFTSGRSTGHDAWTEIYSSPEFYRWLASQRRSERG